MESNLAASLYNDEIVRASTSDYWASQQYLQNLVRFKGHGLRLDTQVQRALLTIANIPYKDNSDISAAALITREIHRLGKGKLDLARTVIEDRHNARTYVVPAVQSILQRSYVVDSAWFREVGFDVCHYGVNMNEDEIIFHKWFYRRILSLPEWSNVTGVFFPPRFHLAFAPDYYDDTLNDICYTELRKALDSNNRSKYVRHILEHKETDYNFIKALYDIVNFVDDGTSESHRWLTINGIIIEWLRSEFAFTDSLDVHYRYSKRKIQRLVYFNEAPLVTLHEYFYALYKLTMYAAEDEAYAIHVTDLYNTTIYTSIGHCFAFWGYYNEVDLATLVEDPVALKVQLRYMYRCPLEHSDCIAYLNQIHHLSLEYKTVTTVLYNLLTSFAESWLLKFNVNYAEIENFFRRVRTPPSISFEEEQRLWDILRSLRLRIENSAKWEV